MRVAEALVLHKCSSVRLPLFCIVAYRGMDHCRGGRWVSHAVTLWDAFPVPPPCCCSTFFYWLLFDSQIAIAKAIDQLEQLAMSFCTEDNILKANFSSCFIKEAYRKMKYQTLIIIQIISLLKPAKLKVDTSIFTTYFLYLVVAKKSKAIAYCPFQIYIGTYKQLQRQFP